MMPYNTIMVDDDTHALTTLQRYIEKIPNLKLIGSFENPFEALAVLSGPEPPQIAFLDIDMPELSGLDLASMANSQVEIIITSAHEQYALEAYGHHVAGYLLKPFSFEQFYKTVQKICTRINPYPAAPSSKPLFFKNGAKGKIIKIMTEEILYIEAMLNYIKIYSISKEQPTILYSSLKDAVNNLGGTHLKRVSRSFVVNTYHLDKVVGGHVLMNGGKKIVIGPNYREQFINYLVSK